MNWTAAAPQRRNAGPQEVRTVVSRGTAFVLAARCTVARASKRSVEARGGVGPRRGTGSRGQDGRLHRSSVHAHRRHQMACPFVFTTGLHCSSCTAVRVVSFPCCSGLVGLPAGPSAAGRTSWSRRCAAGRTKRGGEAGRDRGKWIRRAGAASLRRRLRPPRCGARRALPRTRLGLLFQTWARAAEEDGTPAARPELAAPPVPRAFAEVPMTWADRGRGSRGQRGQRGPFIVHLAPRGSGPSGPSSR